LGCFFPSSVLLIAIGNVEFEIASPGERSLAVSTAVWSIVRMNVHMELQIGQLIERFLAEIAVIRFLSSMDQNMITQIAFLMKTLAANVADEFFEFTVGAYVGLQGG